MYIKLLSMHRKETDSNKRLASALVEKWSRPIFNSTVNFRAQDVQEVVPRFSATELAAQAEEKVKNMGNASADVVPEQKRSGGVTKNGTIVPRPLGMDFHVQPANEVKATASDKCRKDLSPSPSPQPSPSPSPQPSPSPSPSPQPSPQACPRSKACVATTVELLERSNAVEHTLAMAAERAQATKQVVVSSQ